jgi:hypothetical protein
MSEKITFEQAVKYLRDMGYILTEKETSAYRRGTKIYFDSFDIQELGRNGEPLDWHREIYDRRQYTQDGPQIGVYIGPFGMSYGDNGGNSYIEDMETLRKKFM